MRTDYRTFARMSDSVSIWDDAEELAPTAPTKKKSAVSVIANASAVLEPESARTSRRPRDRIIEMFRAPENLRYLRQLFTKKVPAGDMRKFMLETLEDAIYNFDRATEVLGSDPTAMRGANRPAVSAWDELKRLNLAFYSDRMALLREQANLIENNAQKTPGMSRDFANDETESYAMRMFISDSLRPPGLERLNTPGPLFGIREDQTNSERIFRGESKGDSKSHFSSKPALAKLATAPVADSVKAARPRPALERLAAAALSGVKSFMGTKLKLDAPKKPVPKPVLKHAPKPVLKHAPKPVSKHAPASPSTSKPGAASQTDAKSTPAHWIDPIGLLDDTTPPPGHADGDEAWEEGNPNRLPEQAMAEYWGEGKVPTGRTYQGEEEQGGTAYGSLYSWGNNWEKNGGTRFMRRPAIPFWQKLSREGADYDIEETLGTAARETGGQVRRWDMDRLRQPKGETYRRYGQRTGATG